MAGDGGARPRAPTWSPRGGTDRRAGGRGLPAGDAARCAARSALDAGAVAVARARKTTRERLAELLAAQGLRVEPAELRSAEGHQRINKVTLDDDVVTWECWAHGAWGTYTKHVVSYDTMTACVRRGFTLD